MINRNDQKNHFQHMKGWRRKIALLCALMLLVSSSGITAFADTDDGIYSAPVTAPARVTVTPRPEEEPAVTPGEETTGETAAPEETEKAPGSEEENPEGNGPAENTEEITPEPTEEPTATPEPTPSPTPEITFVPEEIVEGEEEATEEPTETPEPESESGSVFLTWEGEGYSLSVTAHLPEDTALEVTEIGGADLYKCLKTASRVLKNDDSPFSKVLKSGLFLSVTLKDAEGNVLNPDQAVSLTLINSEPTIDHFYFAGDTDEEFQMLADDNGVITLDDCRGRIVGFGTASQVQTGTVTLSYAEKDYIVTASYGPEAGFPVDTEMKVREIKPGTAEYALYSGMTEEALNEEWSEITLERYFDITFVSGETELEPQADVDVQIMFRDIIEMTEDHDVAAVHIENNEATVIESDTDSTKQAVDNDEAIDTVTFSSDSFSVFGVVQRTKITTKVLDDKGNTYEIEVTYTQEAEIPENAQIKVEEIPEGSDLWEAYKKQTAAALGADDVRLPGLYDISIIDENGEAVEPKAPVNVSIKLANAEQTNEELHVVHFTEEIPEELVTAAAEEKAAVESGEEQTEVQPLTEEDQINSEKIDAEMEGQTVTFETDGFSVYAFAYTVVVYYKTASGETYRITLNYDENSGIPAGSVLKVEELLPGTDEYRTHLDKAAEALNKTIEDFSAARFFDIEIQKDGTKIEPNGNVVISIMLDEMPTELENVTILHYQKESVDTVEDVEISSANIQFSTESFSVFGVLTEPSVHSVDDLSGKTAVISCNGYYLTSVTIGAVPPNNPIRIKHTQKAEEAALWYFESTGNVDEYYIYTYVDAVKKYINISSANFADANRYHLSLENSPQSLNVALWSDSDQFNIYKYLDGKKCDVDLWDGGASEGFAVYANGNHNNQKLTFTFNTVANDYYAVIVKYGEKYYVVHHDGSLEEVKYNAADNTVKMTTPLLWDYVPNQSGYNLYSRTEGKTFYGGGGVASSFYVRYINADEEDGLAVESASEPADKANASRFVFENNHIKSTTNSNHYIGLEFDSDNSTPLRIAGQKSEDKAAEILLAKVDTSFVPNSFARNHAVNHIDISIHGEAVVNYLLPKGTYYKENGDEWFTVEKGDNKVISIPVEVPVSLNDIKKAEIVATDTSGKVLDNAYYITGYSGNEGDKEEGLPTQVRIEGSFKVSSKVTTAYPSSWTDPENTHWKTGEGDDNWYNSTVFEQIRTQRQQSPITYSVSVTKNIDDFYLKIGNEYLCDINGNKLTGSATVSLSGDCSYWSAKNKCPGIDWNGTGGNMTWGGRDAYNNGCIVGDGIHEESSGIDFTIGGTTEVGEASYPSVTITKYIVDKDGNRIPTDGTIKNTFKIYQIINKTEEQQTAAPSTDYNQYDFANTVIVPVSIYGSGSNTYELSVESAMIYIEEFKDTNTPPSPETITVNGNTWKYVKTYIETEKVYSNDDSSHKTGDLTIDMDAYKSKPEVVGRRGSSPYKEDLNFYVYNVYEPEETTIKVAKVWPDGNIPEDASVTVTLGRYKLMDKSTSVQGGENQNQNNNNNNNGSNGNESQNQGGNTTQYTVKLSAGKYNVVGVVNLTSSVNAGTQYRFKVNTNGGVNVRTWNADTDLNNAPWDTAESYYQLSDNDNLTPDANGYYTVTINQNTWIGVVVSTNDDFTISTGTGGNTNNHKFSLLDLLISTAYADETITIPSGSFTPPTSIPEDKEWVLDTTWSRGVELNSEDTPNWIITVSVDPQDDDGNVYLYFIDSVEESNFDISGWSASKDSYGVWGDHATNVDHNKDTLTVSNTYSTPQYGSITLKKIVAETNATEEDLNKTFHFKIEILTAQDATDQSFNGKHGDATFTKGEATIDLKHDQNATISNLPLGTKYKISETYEDQYDQENLYAQSVTVNGVARPKMPLVDVISGTENVAVVVTNTKVDTIKVHADKIWNAGSLEPTAIQLTLKRTGNAADSIHDIDVATVTPDANGEWKYEWANLERYYHTWDGDVEYTYFVVETGLYFGNLDGEGNVPANGWVSPQNSYVSGGELSYDATKNAWTTTIINTSKIDVPVNKTWPDFSGEEFDWKAGFQLQKKEELIYGNNTIGDDVATNWTDVSGKTIEIRKGQSPVPKFEGLDTYVRHSDGNVYKVTYSAVETWYKVWLKTEDESQPIAQGGQLNHVAYNNKDYIGYVTQIAGENINISSISDRYTIVVNNQPQQNYSNKLVVHKKWLDIMPEDLPYYPAVYVTLYQLPPNTTEGRLATVYDPDGQHRYTHHKLEYNENSDLAWTWVIEDLPQGNADGDYKYFVIEECLDGKRTKWLDNEQTIPLGEYIQTDNEVCNTDDRYYIKIDSYQARDLYGTGAWRDAVFEQPNDAYTGNIGEILIKNRCPSEYMQLDIKKKFLEYRIDENNVTSLWTTTQETSVMSNMIIEIQLYRRVVTGDSNPYNPTVLKNWTAYANPFKVGYKDGPKDIFVDKNGNPFEIKEEGGTWQFRIYDNTQNSGLPRRGFIIHDEELVPVRYQYLFKEIAVYDKNMTPIGGDWTAWLPYLWDPKDMHSQEKVKVFELEIAQDDDRILNTPGTQLTILKDWVGAHSNIKEIYIRVDRRKVDSNGDWDDYTHFICEELKLGELARDYMEGQDALDSTRQRIVLKDSNGWKATIHRVPIYPNDAQKPYEYRIVEEGYLDQNNVYHEITVNDPNFNPTYYKWDRTSNDFELIENNASGLVLLRTNKTANKLMVRNTSQYGSLKIIKEVTDGNEGAAHNTAFEFLVTLTLPAEKTIAANDLSVTGGAYSGFSISGNTVTFTVTITGAGEATINGIPNGTTYTVVEQGLTGDWQQVGDTLYSDTTQTVSVSDTTIDFAKVKNTEVTEIKVDKTWYQANGTTSINSSIENASITVELQDANNEPIKDADGNTLTSDQLTATLNGSTENPAWEYTWTNLRKRYASGTEVAYRVVETAASISDEALTPAEAEVDLNNARLFHLKNYLPDITIDVEKKWPDGQTVPEGTSVTIAITAKVSDNQGGFTEDPTGVTINPASVTLDGITENDSVETIAWKYSWTDLPKYDNRGKLIKYTVEETAYTINSEDAVDELPSGVRTETETGYLFTFNNDIPDTSVKVVKNWLPAGQTVPEGTEVIFEIVAKVSGTTDDPTGVTITPISVTLDGIADNGDNQVETTPWEYEWINLPQYDTKGKLIEYSVKETSYKIGSQYTATTYPEPTVTTVEGTLVFTFENTLPKTERHALKIWDDNNYGSRPTSIIFTLMATAGDNNATVHLDEYTFTGDNPQTVTADSTTGQMQANWTDLPVYTTDGEKITYDVQETVPAKYTQTKKEYKEGTFTWEITNTLVNLKIIKVDDEANPKKLSGAVFELRRKNGSTYAAITDQSVTELDDKGQFTVNEEITLSGITDGEYEIEEISAPAGFLRTNVLIHFTVRDGVFDDPGVDGKVVKYTQKTDSTDTTFQIANTPGAELPATGGSGTLIYTISGLALITLAGVVLISRKRKKSM